MSTTELVKQKLAGTSLQPGTALKQLLDSKGIKARFEDMLGKKAAGFMSSILSATNNNKALTTADPMSVISAAAVAASLDLPINPSLGFAYIVPYKGQAQFQIGWKGLVQLAQRTGQYLTMNVAEVYEGQLVSGNPFTGVMEFKAEAKTSDKVVGYVAYFKLLNGFEKYAYMTTENVQAHGKRYSQSYGKDFSQWTQNFPAMAKKTVLKGLLSKWGIMSIDLQKAVAFDQAAVSKDEQPQYIDATPAADVIPGEEIETTPFLPDEAAAPNEPKQ
jgi:recombination protein RecT